MGNRGEPVGEDHHGSKLTEPQVREIKERLERGEVMASIAEDFPVSKATIGHIKRGRSWAHV